MIKRHSRRELLRTSLQLVCACGALPVATSVLAAESCVEPASESLRGALNYMDPAPDAKQRCGACSYFKADKDPCGSCQIMSGPVSAHAHCDSFAARDAG